MQNLSTVLKSVSKPGRYTGGEFGQIIKDKSKVNLRVAFCFPDTYEIGMSYMGMQLLYHVMNKEEDIFCERVFAPAQDMEEQMKALANLGTLGNFVGMLTDSRSFLSYARHDYFRRIMCNLIGNWVENGEYPNNDAALKKMVEGISFNNAKRYFNL